MVIRLVVGLAFLVGGVGLAQEEGEGREAPTLMRRTVLILGDSLAAGYGVEPEMSFPSLLQSKINDAALPFSVVNAGVSGDTSAGGLRRINWLLKRSVDVLVLELGGNDGLRGIEPATTRSNLQQIIDRTRAKNPRVRIVIAGMRMPGNMGEEFTRAFESLFGELARVNQATLIAFLLEGVGGEPRLNQPDLIHPNEEGHRMVARNVWRSLEPVLLDLVAPAANGGAAVPAGRQ